MTDVDDFAHLPRAEYMFPGPGRDRLVDAILSGAKTATSCLLAELERAGEPLPQVGEREVVVDSAGQPVCVTEATGVQVVCLAAVGDEHAHAEGEGYADAAAWRAGHERFWTSPEMVAELGDPPLTLTDETPVVCTTFRVVHRF